jgi:hypothetical protein
MGDFRQSPGVPNMFGAARRREQCDCTRQTPVALNDSTVDPGIRAGDAKGY